MPDDRPTAARFDRRRFLAWASAVGLGAGSLPTLLAQEAEKAGAITAEAIRCAEKLAGLEFTDAERELMLEGVNEAAASYEALRGVDVGNGVPPALRFDPSPPGVARYQDPARAQGAEPPAKRQAAPDAGPATLHAFSSAADLGRLLRQRHLRSVDLTRAYLARLEQYHPALECVVTLTEERALEAAEAADRRLDAGDGRGPLDGVPWGAKDLFAVAGYPTTWGAAPYRGQTIDADANVVRRLDDAGAVLVAKLTLGALAWGDVWFGGQTKSPWNLEQGSSGSSAGSASATAAGLVGFSLGTETWGSIVSPSTRCGTTGLRPTFGRVSRAGAMALSWSMDKAGPICRTVEDCALVFAAIQGADDPGSPHSDPSAVDAPFAWDPDLDVTKLRVGYVPALFEDAEGEDAEREDEEWKAFDRQVLADLRGMGLELVPIELPDDLPIGDLSFVLSVEAAAAFDELTRSGRDDELVRQIANAWPNVFRQARTVPAVEYVQANRVRTLLMHRWEAMLDGLDAYVVPSFGGSNLLATNLTGHPAVVMPNGFREDGTPTSITFQGRLFGEGALLALAHAWQTATGHHLKHPDLDERIEAWEAAKAKEEAGGED